MKRNLLFVLLMPLFLALSTAAQQNNRGATAAGGATAADMRARFDSVRSRNFPPGSAEGLDEASIRAYTAIIDRHKTKPDARFTEYARFISEATQDSLRSLFTRMSRRQQLEQQLVFLKVEPPKPRQVLSEADFASFSDSTQYNLQLDSRMVPNSALADLKASDIAWYGVDPNMVKRPGSAYFTRRVQLQTNGFYEAAQKRYEKFRDTYVMAYQAFRGERVERPSN
jgi:hypothetical protein